MEDNNGRPTQQSDSEVKNINEIPENILLYILSYLPVKERCIAGRVCKQWRRIVKDNSLWRHVDLLEYKLEVNKMWKVLRAHFSPCLLTMKIQGFAHTFSRKRTRVSISDAMLKELGTRCPNLSLLHLDHCNTHNVRAENLPSSLKTLSITHAIWQPRWMKEKLHHLVSLQTLDLSSTVRVDNFDLRDISQLTSLSSLSLRGCYRVRGADIEVVVKSLPQLVFLDISGTNVDHVGLHHISRHAKGLRELLLKDVGVNDSTLVTLSLGLRELEVLDVTNSKESNALTLDGLKSLFPLPKFKKLLMLDKSGDLNDFYSALKEGFSKEVEVCLL